MDEEHIKKVELQSLLLLYGVKKKEVARMKAPQLKERNKKLKENNTPTKKVKKWTEADKKEELKKVDEQGSFNW